MKAVCFDTPGAPDVMKVLNYSIPKINDEQTVVRINLSIVKNSGPRGVCQTCREIHRPIIRNHIINKQLTFY